MNRFIVLFLAILALLILADAKIRHKRVMKRSAAHWADPDFGSQSYFIPVYQKLVSFLTKLFVSTCFQKLSNSEHQNSANLSFKQFLTLKKHCRHACIQ